MCCTRGHRAYEQLCTISWLPGSAQCLIEQSIAAWEDDGGSQLELVELTGSINQIDWAVQIRRQVDAEFDRVRGALEAIRRKGPMRPGQRRSQIGVLIAILEDKRAEVMR